MIDISIPLQRLEELRVVLHAKIDGAWLLSGTPPTSGRGFLGESDAVDVVFKRSGCASGRCGVRKPNTPRKPTPFRSPIPSRFQSSKFRR